jgi:DNA-binding transcriptional LysR family regulator
MTTLPGTPSLDQLRILVTVVDEGSFSAASRKLNRAQSVISYSIAALEGQLGLAVFERGRRRPVLTEAGRAVLADARRIGLMMDELRARAAGLTRGLESEISLAVDVMYPSALLVGALQDFAARFPTVALRLRIEALGGAVKLVLGGVCHLGISSWMAARFDALDRRQIAAVQMQPVAAPDHKLAQMAPPIPISALRDHIQLVLTDRSDLSEGQDFGVSALRTWRLGDLGAKHDLLRAGLGWGNMPEPMVRDEVADGRLVKLVLSDGVEQAYPLFLIHRTDAPPGPAGTWLAERLALNPAEPPPKPAQ